MPVGAFVPSRIHLDYAEWQAPLIGNVGQVWAYTGSGYAPVALNFDPAGTAAAAVAAHVGLSDPHTQYLLESAYVPPGSNTQVAFNDAGGWGADSGLVFNKTTNVLTCGPLYISGTGDSTLVGYQAGFRDDYGNRQNTAIGVQAGYNTTSGSTNISIGRQALYTNTTGGSNTAIGTQAVYYNVNGSGNTGLGYRALFNNSNGGSNAAFGETALFTNVSGARNAAFGANAGYLSTGNDNVFFGTNAGYNETGSNKLYVSNSNTTKPLIYGEFDTAILKFHSTINTDAVTNTLSLVKRRSSGTPGVGLGVGLRAGLHSSTTEDQDAGRVTWEWVTATHATRASRGKLTAFYASSEQTAITWDGDTGGLKLGFYGVTPVARQVLATGAGATVDNVIAALQALGLVKQS